MVTPDKNREDTVAQKAITKEKIKKWIEENPEGYLEKSYETIADELGISPASVWRHLSNLIAERDESLPSEIKKKRENIGLRLTANKLSPDKIEEICKQHRENPHYKIEDIAYLLDYDVRTIQKYLIIGYSKEHTPEEIAQKLKIKVEIVQRQISGLEETQTE